jgi:hypothetical protein
VETQIEQLRVEALSAVAEASDAGALKEVRVRFLGKTGSVSLLSEGMRTLSKEERPVMGKLLNDLRGAVSAALEEKESALSALTDAAALGLALLEGLSDQEALLAFGEHYRDVLATPEGSDHGNIRALIKHGLAGVKFAELPLSRKA